jgi:hypothetical protein
MGAVLLLNKQAGDSAITTSSSETDKPGNLKQIYSARLIQQLKVANPTWRPAAGNCCIAQHLAHTV